MAVELALDSNVRDWVFIPLTVFIVLVKLCMQYMHQAMNAGGTTASSKTIEEVREMQVVQRSQRVRAAAGVLPESAWRMRREYLAARPSGALQQKPQSRSVTEAMATDPGAMADMMKKNLTGVVPQLVMGAGVSFFFSGFVMGRLPFGLSPRFRPMMQRGVDLASLDVAYFTSLSYYVMLLFASRGPFSLVFREDTLDETELMRRQMNPMAAGPQAFDAAGAFKTELAALEATEHEWALDGAEAAALETLRGAAA